MLFSKNKNEDNSNRGCCYCLFSIAVEVGGKTEYSCKFKKNISPFDLCRKFEFDITKKKPMGIDPSGIKELADLLGEL